jgi:hypothetical protein
MIHFIRLSKAFHSLLGQLNIGMMQKLRIKQQRQIISSLEILFRAHMETQLSRWKLHCTAHVPTVILPLKSSASNATQKLLGMMKKLRAARPKSFSTFQSIKNIFLSVSLRFLRWPFVRCWHGVFAIYW